MSILSALLKVIKHNKKSVLGSVVVSILAAGGATFFDVGENEIKHALFQEESIAEPLQIKINQLSQNMVKRADFNQYIQRKDTEYHEQIATDEGLIKSIGELDGAMKESDEVLSRIAGKKDDP